MSPLQDIAISICLYFDDEEALEPVDAPHWIDAHVALLMDGLRVR